MNTEQLEYQKQFKKIQDSDFSHNWVSSSAFIFYLSVACIVALVIGASMQLSTHKFKKAEVNIQESTLYTPKYK